MASVNRNRKLEKGVIYVEWRDNSTNTSYSVSGNDRAAYVKAASKIQAQINAGHSVSKEALDIIQKAEYIGWNPGSEKPLFF